MRRLFLAAALLALAISAVAQDSQSVFSGLKWRMIGPFRGGRALAVTGVPNNPNKYYFGSVGGGVWVTENSGRTWTPIFDGQPVASIGAIAVAPSDPNVIYVGSGEADMRSDIQQGNGMYKSTDGGKTWSHIGLEDTRQIGKVLVDPKDPNTVFVAALGHQYGPNEDRGVFKSTDGGQNWSKVLYKDPNIGAIDMDFDPTDTNVVYAALWSTRRPPWSVYPPSNGPGGGLFKSTDAGHTWSQLQGGLPSFTGRIGVTVSPANHNRVYALVDTNEPKSGGVYRSDDGGQTWTHSSGDRRVWGRGWYFAGITADPKNPDEVYAMNTSAYRSTDGGKTFIPFKGAPGGDDYHTLWIQPNNPDQMILGSDQGVVVSVDGGKTWSSWYNQPTAQLYHVTTDNRFPYWVYGAQQDSGAVAVPSRTIHTGVGAFDARNIDAGGESDMVAADPLHPGVIFGSNNVREDLETAANRSIDPTLSYPFELWRSEWTHPIAVSPSDPHRLYMAHQKVFESQDGGASWKLISPDLTRPSTPIPGNLDPATAKDDTGIARKGVVYWIAPSPRAAQQVWAGTDDGLIWLTTDNGANWQNVTPSELGAWSKIGVIDASHFDVGTAYAAVDRHRVDDNQPYIYRTHDFGRRWELITNGLPKGQFVNVVREDPVRRGLLYAGTDWGVFISLDDGANWQPLQLNLPAASVRDIVFQDNDVIVGTHGRSIWILDNPTALRQVGPQTFANGVYLFQPGAAMLFQHAASWNGPMDEGTPVPLEEPRGENPPTGAAIDYFLAAPARDVELTIRDAKGAVVRRYSGAEAPKQVDVNSFDIPAYWIHPAEPLSGEPGGHRFLWNLRYLDDGGALVPPGRYDVELTANGQHYRQPFSVISDPRLHLRHEDLQEQFAFGLQVRDELKRVGEAQGRAAKLLEAKGHDMPAADLEKLKRLIGKSGRETPDNGGEEVEDVSSLRFVGGALGNLAGAVASAPGAPTANYRHSFDLLKKQAEDDMAALKALGG